MLELPICIPVKVHCVRDLTGDVEQMLISIIGVTHTSILQSNSYVIS